MTLKHRDYHCGIPVDHGFVNYTFSSLKIKISASPNRWLLLITVISYPMCTISDYMYCSTLDLEDCMGIGLHGQSQDEGVILRTNTYV